MLNLLFISDSPKIEYIKSALQPVLKVIIDIVPDFDHGLKDVFDKRPSIACIQDQIGGVTGESVARHIQMLLGSSAPAFILLHSGSEKAKAIKGVFEHLVDLSESQVTLAEEIQRSLKSLLGDQWDKIYIPPKHSSSLAGSTIAVSEKSNEDSDGLVNDLFSDLELSRFPVDFHQPPETAQRPENPPGIIEPVLLITPSEEVEALLLSEKNRAVQTETPALPSSVVTVEHESVFGDPQKSAAADIKLPPPIIPEFPEPSETSRSRTPSVKPAVPAPGKIAAKTLSTPATSPPTPTAAEFRISHKASPAEEHIPEDLLLAFEENYRSESQLLRRSVITALMCVICAAGVWSIVTQKPQLLGSLKQRVMSLTGIKQPPVTVPVVVPAQLPVTPAPVPQPVEKKSLPSFIPIDGLDSSYTVKNPGWERFVSKLVEFRVFRASGFIQAVQVLAVKDAPVSDKFLKSVLQELVGSSEYLIVSRSTKAGIHVERGTIMDKGDVVIYRKNGVVKAFVVSINKN